jgi:DNA-binding XRE family transcriptional regulator
VTSQLKKLNKSHKTDQIMKPIRIKPDKTGLIALRNLLGFNQELLALYLNVNLSTLKMAEAGLRPLPTDALIKVAELIIRMAARPLQVIYEDAHPAEEICPEIFKDHYRQLTVKQNKCADECLLYESKLASMKDTYLKARKRLQMIETVMLENKAGDSHAIAWQKQKESAISMLNRSGRQAQAILQGRINILNAETELCKKLKMQIKGVLLELFTEDNDLMV